MDLPSPLSIEPLLRRTQLAWLRSVGMVLLAAGLGTSIGQVKSASATTEIHNQASVSYEEVTDPGIVYSGLSEELETTEETILIDPLGQILACDGTLLSDYTGFSVALYEPDASGLDLANLLALTTTEVPDIANNAIPAGKSPNVANVNPFGLTNGEEGTYNFLFDPTTSLQSAVNAGLTQTDEGAQYILVVSPPATSDYSERRIKIEILSSSGDSGVVSYRATALDGIPLSATGGTQISDTVVEVSNAETEGLSLFSLAFSAILCESEQIDITKTADRASAQPGDTVVYRVLVENLIDVDLESVVITDILPAGFQLLPDSATALIGEQFISLSVESDGNNATFSLPGTLSASESVEIIYAARLTPDALRGTGENSAAVNGRRVDNNLSVQDGPSVYRVAVDPGLLSDCGTLIGRVFVDKNFDGEQQPGEAGIPNAVIFLEDGNRIVTDADGLYSVACLLPGHHSGVLDLTSLPGYTLAPNLYFNERNSQSRLVRLAPGGLARMNFAVTPAFQEATE
ncbi:MAG: hypothetical protein AAF766_13600 [Cyanobacteria bacterium P01_D01_bin.14]